MYDQDSIKSIKENEWNLGLGRKFSKKEKGRHNLLHLS